MVRSDSNECNPTKYTLCWTLIYIFSIVYLCETNSHEHIQKVHTNKHKGIYVTHSIACTMLMYTAKF